MADAIGEVDLAVRSSDQWFTVMDRMIKLAAAELIEKTQVAEYCVSRLVVFQHANKRRGLSMNMGKDEWTWSDVVSAMIGFMADPSLERFEALRLDRAYSQGMLKEFLRATEGYESLVEGAFNDPGVKMLVREKVDAIHDAVGKRPGTGKDILQTVASIAYLDEEVTHLRNRILQVFAEYINRMAAYDAAHHPLRVSQRDTKQNYYLAAMKAVNHFNQERGSFKSYLDIWLKKARNANSHVTGSAYTAPSGAKANHIAVSMDKVDGKGWDDEEDEKPEGRTAELVRLVDPEGYLSEAMGLETA